jgi:hypothetical protein
MTRSLVVTALAWLAVGCKDPMLTERAESLGPDRGTYEIGPNHRAGFPCTWCHAKGSIAEPRFDLGGTVYSRADSDEALQGVRVRLFDRHGKEQTLESNQAGNFYFAEDELALEFPLWVKLEYGDEVTAMQTPIFRERSCAGCHLDPASPTSAGRVYLYEGK